MLAARAPASALPGRAPQAQLHGAVQGRPRECKRHAGGASQSTLSRSRGRSSRLLAMASAASSSASLTRTPAAKAAIFTGTYATLAGLALALAPKSSFGLLFDASVVPSGWIRLGGILFALIGMQYLGTGLGDAARVATQAAGGPAQGVSAAQAPTPAQGTQQQQQQQALGYARSFYTATVWSRAFLVAGFVALAATGALPPALLVLAVLNVAGAASMALAVRKTDALLGWHASAGGTGAGSTAGAGTGPGAKKMEDGLEGINDCNPLGL